MRMTVASEIERLQGAKSNIKASIEGKGVTVPATAKLDSYAGYIDQIEAGDGDDIIHYMSGILSIDGPSVYISGSDRVNDRYSDYSWKDGEYLYLVRPYEYDNYSSSGASHMETYANCVALKKGASTTNNYDPQIRQGGYYTTTYIDYYYINGNAISFYGRTGEYTDTYRCVTLTCNDGTWSMTSTSRDGNAPAHTGGNQNLFYSSVDGCLSHDCNFHYKWRPN